jgi:hypothetical protein
MSFLNFKDKKDHDNIILKQERDKEIQRNNNTPIV